MMTFQNTANVTYPQKHLPNLILIGRHGQTVSNRDGLIMGGTDSPLTSAGFEDTKALIQRLKGVGLVKIFSSPLGRAALTASVYSENFGVPVCYRTSLAELSAGLWEGKYRSDVRGDIQSLRSTWTERPPGGESYADGETRVMTLIDEISSGTINGGVLLIGHASVNRVFLKMILDLESTEAVHINFPNHLIYTILPGKEVRYLTSAGSSGHGLLFEVD